METVAVVGVGLIGASFGLALRRAGFSGRIIGVSSPRAIKAGLDIGAISDEMSLENAAEIADLIYLAQPVERILNTIELLGKSVNPNCLITDAGSTKGSIVKRALDHLPRNSFLGGHPMAGKEQRGANAADGTLFSGRPYVLTPSGELTDKMSQLQSWLRRIEARVVVMSPAEHDNVVALTSHLPQLLSTAISITLAQQNNARLREVFGPGLLDMTRLAMSSPDLWQSILDTNRHEIIKALNELTENVKVLHDCVQSGKTVDDLFATARTFALDLRKKKN
ncbi:MAG TPA: prephenate dehydrogenase/arogenate dehydrogenase family protein [Bryobacteraceae bacterium]|nr:prephenate dehydrogenase/arogenate dehydrogenase family protein [Bryobacteraceae bacterium]